MAGGGLVHMVIHRGDIRNMIELALVTVVILVYINSTNWKKDLDEARDG